MEISNINSTIKNWKVYPEKDEKLKLLQPTLIDLSESAILLQSDSSSTFSSLSSDYYVFDMSLPGRQSQRITLPYLFDEMNGENVWMIWSKRRVKEIEKKRGERAVQKEMKMEKERIKKEEKEKEKEKEKEGKASDNGKLNAPSSNDIGFKSPSSSIE